MSGEYNENRNEDRNEFRRERRRGPGGPMGGGGEDERAKDFKGSLIKLVRYCKQYLAPVLISIVVASGGAILSILGPDRLQEMTREIMKGLPSVFGAVADLGIDLDAVTKIGFTLIAFYAASAILNFIQGFLMATVTQRASEFMRSDISRKINRLPFSYFDKVSYGDVLSRITNDVDTISMSMNQSVGTLVTAITMFIGSIIMMFRTDLYMSLTAIGASVIGFGIMILIMSRSQKYFKAQQDGLGDLNGHIEEIYEGHTIVKAYNGGKAATEKFEKLNTGLYDSGWKSQFISGLMPPLMGFIGNFGYVAVCIVGAALVINGTFGYDVIVAFILYIRLFTQPLSQIAQASQNLQRTVAGAERVFEFLEETELSDEREKPRALTGVRGDVDFKNVRFGYVQDVVVIKDFSAKVSAGQKIAIVGPTGAGKTTIVNLLMRFYELDGGSISIDGTPLTNVPRENVHEQFCMVLQDSWMFEGTIKENIIYCKQGVTEGDVISACETVGLHHFISMLPQGYDTVLNDKVSLSQGQKQLITIARAMVQNAPMLILDEATSSVDTRTEQQIQEAMDKLTVGRTSFVIAHRLSTIKNADLILVINNGDIIESGRHIDLIDKGGFYSELWKSQFEAAEIA